MTTNYKKTLIVLALILLFAGLLTYYFVSYRPLHSINKDTLAVFSNTVDELPYTDLNGNTISLDKYLGKILVVVSWASWSPFSQGDIATLNELAEKYHDQEIVFIAINRKETREQAARYMSTLPESTGVIIVMDPRDNFYNAVGGYAMPEAVVYDKYGEIIQHQRGVADKQQIIDIIDQSLSSK